MGEGVLRSQYMLRKEITFKWEFEVITWAQRGSDGVGVERREGSRRRV